MEATSAGTVLPIRAVSPEFGAGLTSLSTHSTAIWGIASPTPLGGFEVASVGGTKPTLTGTLRNVWFRGKADLPDKARRRPLLTRSGPSCGSGSTTDSSSTSGDAGRSGLHKADTVDTASAVSRDWMKLCRRPSNSIVEPPDDIGILAVARA